MKIPLTLAIIDGMNLKVGNNCYTIPTIAIKESFRPKEREIITDPDNNEMIMVRGQCYPILRLHQLFQVNTKVTDFTKGIIIMVEQDERMVCIFADELIGQQQVVVKAMPKYIMSFKKIKELAGCTLLGDGSISLILNIAGLFN
jgi:two-component system chemotaxis sensor kinase CheA